MKKQDLLNFLIDAKESNLGVLLYLEIDNFPKKEQVSIPNENIPMNLKHIDEDFTDNLILKSYQKIKIVDYCYISLED